MLNFEWISSFIAIHAIASPVTPERSSLPQSPATVRKLVRAFTESAVCHFGRHARSEKERLAFASCPLWGYNGSVFFGSCRMPEVF